MCITLGMLFVKSCFKSVLHVVLCGRYGVLWCKRGEAVEKRRGGEGERCCLRADHGIGIGKLEECSASR